MGKPYNGGEPGPSLGEWLEAMAVAPCTMIPPVPPIPEDVKKRFPSMAQWEQKMAEWRRNVNVVMGFKGEG